VTPRSVWPSWRWMTFKGSFAGHLDGVRVAQLVGREPAPHAAFDGEPAQMGTDRSRRPWPAAGRAFDHAEQPSDWAGVARWLVHGRSCSQPQSSMRPRGACRPCRDARAALRDALEVSLARSSASAMRSPDRHSTTISPRVRSPWTSAPAWRITAMISSTWEGRRVAQALVARRRPAW